MVPTPQPQGLEVSAPSLSTMPVQEDVEFGLVLAIEAVEPWGIFINMSNVWDEHQSKTLLDIPAETVH